MRVYEARAIALDWILEYRETSDDYIGAYLAGSICWMDESDVMSPSSDIDIRIVVERDELPTKPGKIRYRGALLEPDFVARGDFDDLESMMIQPTVSASIARNQILDDPFGVLRPGFDYIASEFSLHHRVMQRLDFLEASIRQRTSGIDETTPFHDQAMWVFPATVSTFLPLIAGLRNPTVRRRFVETRRLLEEYGELTLHDRILGFIGCHDIAREEAEQYLDHLTVLYDRAVAAGPTVSRWKSDISADVRVISIDGTREMIEQGYHREAMFWIVATFTRSLNVLANTEHRVDITSELGEFHTLMERLGLASTDDLRRRTGEILAALTEVRAAANRILDRNPEVVFSSQDH